LGKSKYIFVIIFIIVLLLILGLIHCKTNIITTDKQTAIVTNHKLKTDTKTISLKSIESKTFNNNSQQKPLTNNNPEMPGINIKKKCISISEANELAEHSVMGEWFRDTLFINGTSVSNLISSYQYMDEESLLEVAQGGDSKAMWVLGKNYFWQSTHNNFHSKYLLPNTISFVEYELKPLDLEMLEKSRYWLFLSALHGEYAGLIEYQSTFFKQFELLKETTDIETALEYLTPNIIAIGKLMDWAFPSFPKAFGPTFQETNIRDEKYSDEILEKYEVIFEQLKNKWISQRNLLGYPEKVDMFVPVEVSDIYKMIMETC